MSGFPATYAKPCGCERVPVRIADATSVPYVESCFGWELQTCDAHTIRRPDGRPVYPTIKHIDLVHLSRDYEQWVKDFHAIKQPSDYARFTRFTIWAASSSSSSSRFHLHVTGMCTAWRNKL